MLQQLREKKKAAQDRGEGFTIIEVMIVLVIAAVIILIVFLAVPALQRNSRNNQRKGEVSRILAAMTEFSNSHDGTLPTNGILSANTTDMPEMRDIIGDLNFYTYADISIISTGASRPSDAGKVVIQKAFVCTDPIPATGAISSTTGATARQFLAQYAVESGGATATPQCTEG